MSELIEEIMEATDMVVVHDFEIMGTDTPVVEEAETDPIDPIATLLIVGQR